MNKAVVIIPTYNERATIAKTLDAVFTVFRKVKGWQMSVLVVDDTSPDKTYEYVEELQTTHTQLHLLVNKKKSGLGGAYLKGMEYAFDTLGAEVVFEFDADLSHDPSKIPVFLEKIDNGADMVLGSRYVEGGGIPDDWGLDRKFLSVVGNWIIMLVLADFRIRDWTTGYRAITKNVYDSVHSEMTNTRFSGYTFQIAFLHKTVRKGFLVKEVPFKFIDRTEGQSKLGPEYIKNTLIYILKARILEIIETRIFKFVIAGGVGTLVQLVSLQFIWRQVVFYDLAVFLSIETAIISNFFLSNLWTFADRTLSLREFPAKFLQFNVASVGSILIQQLIASGGNFLFGLFVLFTLPVLSFSIDTGLVYAVCGILVGMFWNYFAYNRFIWRKKV